MPEHVKGRTMHITKKRAAKGALAIPLVAIPALLNGSTNAQALTPVQNILRDGCTAELKTEFIRPPVPYAGYNRYRAMGIDMASNDRRKACFVRLYGMTRGGGVVASGYVKYWGA